MKILFGLLALAAAGKGGRKGLHGRAEIDPSLNPRGKKGLKKNDKTVQADGGSITHRNYKNNERIQWTVKASGDNVVLLQFDKQFDVQHHIQCLFDTVTVTTFLDGQEIEQATFCGPNKANFLTMPQDGPHAGLKFPNTGKLGQKAYHYPWNTYADEVRVEFESDGEIGGSGFEISFSEAERQFECSNRKDCTHIGLNQHICDFDKVTNDKVCKKARVTIIIS